MLATLLVACLYAASPSFRPVPVRACLWPGMLPRQHEAAHAGFQQCLIRCGIHAVLDRPSLCARSPLAPIAAYRPHPVRLTGLRPVCGSAALALPALPQLCYLRRAVGDCVRCLRSKRSEFVAGRASAPVLAALPSHKLQTKSCAVRLSLRPCQKGAAGAVGLFLSLERSEDASWQWARYKRKAIYQAWLHKGQDLEVHKISNDFCLASSRLPCSQAQAGMRPSPTVPSGAGLQDRSTTTRILSLRP